MALMGKWGWRVIEGEKAVWVDVVVENRVNVRGDLSGLRVIRPGVKVRGWGGDVLDCLRDKVGCWFEDSCQRRVGNGEGTFFWGDRWVSDLPLRCLFPKLFDLCLQKDCSVQGAGGWEDNHWRWDVGWRRELREWEVANLNDLSTLLSCRKLNMPEVDRWSWKLEAHEGYSVRSSYRFLADRKASEEQGIRPWTRMIWKSWAVPKAKAIAWRVLVGRIASKVELVKRGALGQNQDPTCALCGKEDETINHLFSVCKRTWELWYRVIGWVGVHTPLPGNVEDSISFFYHLGGRKRTRFTLASIWICVVWSIWNSRNEIVFNNKEWKPEKIFNDVKSVTWSCHIGSKICNRKEWRFRDWCSNSPIHLLDSVNCGSGSQTLAA